MTTTNSTQANQSTKVNKLGHVLIVIGIIGFLGAVILSFTPLAGLDTGALPAGSFLIVMLGLAFAFPSLLEESKGELSTMRIIVFAVVMVFCVIYLKIGWSIGSIGELTIDKAWIYILGLAFGSKVFQKFGEEEESLKAEREVQTPGGTRVTEKVQKKTDSPKGDDKDQ
jgi:heme/copper-type cytochrome/quinol oxidase subunit 4